MSNDKENGFTQIEEGKATKQFDCINRMILIVNCKLWKSNKLTEVFMIPVSDELLSIIKKKRILGLFFLCYTCSLLLFIAHNYK